MALKPYKKDFGYTYAFGVSATLEMLRQRPQDAFGVHIHAKGARNTGVEEIRSVAEKHNIEIIEASAGIDRLTNTENTYAVGVFRKYEQTLQTDTNHLVLAQIQDKGNLGTIIRTMLAFDFADLAIIKPAVDVFDPKVVRASMGALFGIRFSYFSTFTEYQTAFPRQYYPFMTDAQTTLIEAKFTTPYSLIFGSESEGLHSTYKTIGDAISIPQSHDVDSLNLSISVGIALFTASITT
jgi:RNA methyltransferase, TrmH family